MLSLYLAIVIQTFSPYSVAGARVGSVGEVVSERRLPMLRKTIITIAISAVLGGAVALAPIDATARGGGGGGGGHGGGGGGGHGGGGGGGHGGHGGGFGGGHGGGFAGGHSGI